MHTIDFNASGIDVLMQRYDDIRHLLANIKLHAHVIEIKK